ncbi:beta-lactamase family protein [Candidatus Saccharibacteria bacterium]|nr:beta-lactamase family protein [Candidatus Saccharibacteria bacterium]
MNQRALKKAADYMHGWLQTLYEHDTIPGFVVAVAHKGKLVFNEAYGYANLEKKEKMTPQHIFRVASHSKTFTATAVMQLQEQGSLRIDDQITDYLVWLKDHKDKRWQTVTIRQLLSHGAGVIRDGEKSDYWQLEYPFPDKTQLKKEILACDLVIDNNTKLKYSNYGYSLLGMLIEKVSKESYHDFVKRNIIKPLGLKNTGPEIDNQVEKRLVTGYSRKDFNGQRLPVTSVRTNGMAAATGFYATAEDLCTYFTAHSLGSGKLLNDESKKEMQKTHWTAEHTHDKEEYGLGLDIDYINEHRLIGHGGGFPGNITKSYYDPEEQLAIILLTNANGVKSGHLDSNIVKLLDYFNDNCAQSSRFEKYEGHNMDLWGIRDVLAIGNKLAVGWGASWEPFANPDELEHLKDNIFKITKTTSWDSYGEQVKFELDRSGKVMSINFAGSTLIPVKEYIDKSLKRGRIG